MMSWRAFQTSLEDPDGPPARCCYCPCEPLRGKCLGHPHAGGIVQPAGSALRRQQPVLCDGQRLAAARDLPRAPQRRRPGALPQRLGQLHGHAKRCLAALLAGATLLAFLAQPCLICAPPRTRPCAATRRPANLLRASARTHAILPFLPHRITFSTSCSRRLSPHSRRSYGKPCQI
jgi:hypothetical protein